MYLTRGSFYKKLPIEFNFKFTIRSGRTGRAGRPGNSVVIYGKIDDEIKLRQMEHFGCFKFTDLPHNIPSVQTL